MNKILAVLTPLAISLNMFSMDKPETEQIDSSDYSYFSELPVELKLHILSFIPEVGSLTSNFKNISSIALVNSELSQLCRDQACMVPLIKKYFIYQLRAQLALRYRQPAIKQEIPLLVDRIVQDANQGKDMSWVQKLGLLIQRALLEDELVKYPIVWKAFENDKAVIADIGLINFDTLIQAVRPNVGDRIETSYHWNSISGDRTEIRDNETGMCINLLARRDFIPFWQHITHLIAISKDGDFTVTVTGNQIEIWDSESGKCMQTIDNGEDQFISAAISEDDTFVIAVTNDNTVIKYQTPYGQEFATILDKIQKQSSK